MAQRTLTAPVGDNAQIDLTGDNCKLWLGYGLPDYEGSIDGLEQAHPEIFAELIERNLIPPDMPHGLGHRGAIRTDNLSENVMARENAVVEMTEVKDGDAIIGLTFKVAGAGSTSVMFGSLSPEVRKQAVVYGIGVRVSRMAAIARDTKSGKSATPAEKFARIKACAEHYNSGADTWELARGATGPRGPDHYTQLVIEAVARIQSLTVEEMTVRVKALCEKRDETVAAWAKRMAAAKGEIGDRIREIVLELQQADAPSADDIDDELDELMNS